MFKKDFSKRIFLSLTGETEDDWQAKIKEINSLGIDTVALFLEFYRKPQREKIYMALEKSSIKKIPLVHIKNDMDKEELKYLCAKYNNPCLTIHENSFDNFSKWAGYHHHLYLEMNYNNSIPRNVEVEKTGGFCIDLSHFKAAEEKWSKEFEYVIGKRKKKDLFRCNHLNGYSYAKNEDRHIISSLDEFDYLKTLPEFVFGDIIALEVFNSISDQIMYKKYIVRLLEEISYF
ncbi:MAG: hypothetical protein US30_C0019G0015 [Candidatus Moranbacteria bacterium GW2011_GWF2_36_839]|nr:MAG: hypothetical protein US27_C0020G0015 [Candidatus Moranbacteria bacterium GW2011_GWF1_36_78]KKQ16312.1 MAG: hypothetical protein US30_C0019G0015 [Candidatus Moranbacteria bacterium GW2011_GWF2_36_839]HAT74190.1 hypothetical protein [Candidatus Moranbacteria bacterium]HBY10627.1 hypothetical protein [Candidatus Moranbacteria bacterium]